jgi:hypothetical protein
MLFAAPRGGSTATTEPEMPAFDSTQTVRALTPLELAEHDRFQERRVAARKDVGATGTHMAIELTSRPALPERRARVEVTTAKQSTPSLWSRLLKR